MADNQTPPQENFLDILNNKKPSLSTPIKETVESISIPENTIAHNDEKKEPIVEKQKIEETLPEKTQVEKTIKEITNGKYENIGDLLKKIDDTETQLNTERNQVKNLIKDDFIRNAVEYYNENGTLKPYLKAALTDYDTLEDEDILREDFKEKNPEYSAKTFERIFKKEMQKYEGEEDMEPEDKELLLEKKHIAADRIRKTLKENSKKYLEPSQDRKAKQEEIERQQKTFIDTLNSKDEIKNLFTSKKIHYNDENFDMDIENPEDVYRMFINPQSVFESLGDKEKGINFNKSFKVFLHAVMGDDYDKKIIEKARERFEAEIKNTTINTPSFSGNKAADMKTDTPEFLKMLNSK